jgi:hypothetical protein
MTALGRAVIDKGMRASLEKPPMTLRTYEITFEGEAFPAIATAFEEFEVIVGGGTTTLRGSEMDQSALYGVFDRLQGLRLELLEVRSLDNPPSDEVG